MRILLKQPFSYIIFKHSKLLAAIKNDKLKKKEKKHFFKVNDMLPVVFWM